MPDKILIVDDEVDLATTIAFNLEQEGFQTALASTGSTALAQAKQPPYPDLILLDLMLPDLSGTEICRQLRQHQPTRHIPIIMLTARGSDTDRIVGLELGADDYIVKPFNLRELILRVRAVLKRHTDAHTTKHQVIEFGILKLDIDGHRVWLDNDEILLTALEFKLLQTLIERRDRVQSRDVLLDTVWGHDAVVTTRTVDTHIKRLREKIGLAAQYIETIRGVGYRMNLPTEGAPN